MTDERHVSADAVRALGAAADLEGSGGRLQRFLDLGVQGVIAKLFDPMALGRHDR